MYQYIFECIHPLDFGTYKYHRDLYNNWEKHTISGLKLHNYCTNVKSAKSELWLYFKLKILYMDGSNFPSYWILVIYFYYTKYNKCFAKTSTNALNLYFTFLVGYVMSRFFKIDLYLHSRRKILKKDMIRVEKTHPFVR